MTRRHACLVALFTLGLTTAAQAAELFTPPLFPELTDVLMCEIVNVSTRTQTVRIRVIDSNGRCTGPEMSISPPAGSPEGVFGQPIQGSVLQVHRRGQQEQLPRSGQDRQ
jgi:hypothetical protein